MIQILHAAFVYQSPDGEVEALRDVSFDVQEGEFCSIVGPSGCGKSTLLSALAGLEPLTGGRVELKGEPVCGPSRKVGFMPQRDQLFEWRSIWGNVTLGLTVRGENTPQRQAHVRELLERLSPRCCCWMSPFRRWTIRQGWPYRRISTASYGRRARRRCW